MITKIGIVAGDIWNYLEGHGKQASMDEIVTGLQKEREIVLMGLGWLAREGHIVMEGTGPEYTVLLTQ